VKTIPLKKYWVKLLHWDVGDDFNLQEKIVTFNEFHSLEGSMS
jgi:hypothetical protein